MPRFGYAVALALLTLPTTLLAQAATPTPCRTTNVISVDDYGCAGDGSTDDTTCIQDAINVAQGNGYTVAFGSKTYKITADLTVTSGDVTLLGTGQTTILSAESGAGDHIALDIHGAGLTTSTTVSANVNCSGGVSPCNERATETARQISVASTSGLTNGDWIFLRWNAGTYSWSQVTRIRNQPEGISGTTLKFSDRVLVPLLSSDTGNVREISMIENVVVDGIRFDGTALTTTGLHTGLYMNSCAHCRISNVYATDYRSSGIWTYYTYKLNAHDITTVRSGDNGYSDQYYWHGSNGVFDTISSARAGDWDNGQLNVNCTGADAPHDCCTGSGAGNCDGFGPQWIGGVNTAISGVSVSDSDSRAIKFHSVGWFTAANLIATNGGATGIGITLGSYASVFTNLMITGGGWVSGAANEGLWFSDQNNVYNTLSNVRAYGNTSCDIQLFASDDNNRFMGVVSGTCADGSGTGSFTSLLTTGDGGTTCNDGC